jgi:hypothetical protein
LDDSYSLKLCPAYAGTYDPKKIDLPIKRIKDHSYTILDTTDGQIFVSINHEGDSSKMTNVYVSDYRGLDFSISLLNNVRDEEGNSDFEKILSNEGVYIANHYDHAKIEKIKKKQVDKYSTSKLS